MTILDCHVHVLRYPDHFPDNVYVDFTGARQRGVSEEEIKRSADRPVERVLREMEEAGSDKALVLGLKSGTTLGWEVPNEYIGEVVKPHSDRLAWACAVVMTEEGAADEVQRCVKELGAVAIGEIGPGYGHFRIDDPRCYPVYEVARSLDVPLVIHAGPVVPPTAYLKYGNLEALDEVCVKFPDLKIVLCHFGQPYYQEAAHLMAKHPNLYADTSLMVRGSGLGSAGPTSPTMTYTPLHLEHPLLYYFSLPARDRDKLLWASDVELPKDALEGMRGVNKRLDEHGLPKIPQDAIERMFHENWLKVFPKISG